ncbi:MAG: aminoglycoside phosphotransferase family protein [Victivallaceae bacterium]|nr:aminoglycoside phosphotransferase family protein [Victivallaceae bacterium]
MSNIYKLFQLHGDFIDCAPYGSGHINDTFKLTLNQAGNHVSYILQRLNTTIFTDPVGLMDNIERVTTHLGAKLNGRDASRRTLRIVPAADGKNHAVDSDGRFWRCYWFIEKAAAYDVLPGEKPAFEAAKAFANFQRLLADLPKPRLNETIPDFHNTPKRFAALKAAAAADKMGRLASARPEFDFFMAHEIEAPTLLDAGLPERITHNDTKLNNVMLDDETKEGVCVIDLDTVMPGLAHYDFGDMVRTGTSPAAEDELDLGKVTMRFNMFEALLRGYLTGAAGFLTPEERELLPFSGKLITMEIGARFLTDYLAGDVYFKIHRPAHNLDRCRTQIALAKSIEAQMPEMMKLTRSVK